MATTIVIDNVPDEAAATLRRKAAEAGEQFEAYIARLLERAADSLTLEEVLASILESPGTPLSAGESARLVEGERERRELSNSQALTPYVAGVPMSLTPKIAAEIWRRRLTTMTDEEFVEHARKYAPDLLAPAEPTQTTRGSRQQTRQAAEAPKSPPSDRLNPIEIVGT